MASGSSRIRCSSSSWCAALLRATRSAVRLGRFFRKANLRPLCPGLTTASQGVAGNARSGASTGGGKARVYAFWEGRGAAKTGRIADFGEGMSPSKGSHMQTRVEGKPNTTKRMLIMIGAVLLLILLIAAVKALMIYKMVSGMKPPPPSVVSTAKATYQDWQPELRAVGSLRAARGADLALDVAGLVTAVNVKSGDEVKQGQLLLQLRDAEDVAQLRQLEAAANLSQVTYERAK